jgi:ankyrin repeat protein
VNLLVERGANVNAVSKNGFSPLLFAAQRGDVNSAKALLAAKADPKFKAKDGGTAFLIALGRGNEAVTRLMLDYGGDVNALDANGNMPLHEAIRQGKVDLMKDLVARGADVNARTPGGGRGGRGGGGGGMTAFLVAAQGGNVAMIQELVKLGADSKGKLPDGTGGILLATGSKKLDAVKLMVELGLDVNDAPKGRPSALHSAIKQGANDIVQYLADHGADFAAKDNFGRTPLEEAEFEAPASTIALMRKLMAERQTSPKQ